MTGMLSQPGMLSVAETAKKIEDGQFLSVAGVEELLEQLPKGSWIGGTSPYFMAPDGGLQSTDKLYVDTLPREYVTAVSVKVYKQDELSQIPADEPEHGFSIMAIPAFSEPHLSFGMDAPSYPGIYQKPLIGWVPGVHLSKLGERTPAVYDGTTATRYEQAAVVMHASMVESHGAIVEQVNLFDSSRPDSLTFKTDGFVQAEVLVNGESRNFAEYVRERGIDTRLPLVAQPYGAHINVGVREVPASSDPVQLYGPVFRGIDYKFADELTSDYVSAFRAAVGESHSNVVFSSNCIDNFQYSELEGAKLPLTGPVTFGEIAYQLINQTLVYLKIVEL